MTTKTRTKTKQKQTEQDFANELRDGVIAIELMLQQVGRRRIMSERHRDQVADHFGAQRRAVGGSKRLYSPKQAEIKKIAGVLCDTRRAWLGATIGYRRGIRLLRKEQLDSWIARFEQLQAELKEALAAADAVREEILANSREFLGDELFDLNDYPLTFEGSVSIAWAVHNFEPSDELLRLAPETYQREQERVRLQFQEAIAAYEQEARGQLAKLVDALLEKLNAAAAGKKVVYSEGATANLQEFFDRFDRLNIRSDKQLNELVAVARGALGNTTANDLKDSVTRRQSIAAALDKVANKLGKCIIEAPIRMFDLADLD